MGLIRMAANLVGGAVGAGINSVGGVLADQWVDFFTCDSLNENVLMVQGKRPQQSRSVNTKGSENIITNGSKINIADGQCMIIIENGMIADFCAEPGQYTYNNTIAPSLLGGGFKDLGATFAQIGKRFTAGGAPTDQQKIYYVNTKEIINNKIGWGKIPFRHYDPEFDKSIVVQVQGFGMYTFTISNPLLFYRNVVGNITDTYTKETLMTTMKAEVMSALNPALGKIALTKIPYDELILYPEQLGAYINETVSPKWGSNRGIEIKSFAVESITVDDESAKKIAQLQETAIHTDAGMAAARLATAQANAMENAAKNQGGAVTGLMGVGMAQGAGGTNAADLFKVANENKAKKASVENQAQNISSDNWTCSCGKINTGKFCDECGEKKPESASGWTCSCGKVNTGKFCDECGAKKPENTDSWTCSCGTVNSGKFCSECGKERAAKITCPNCGWEPEDASKMPKFCPECGEKF